MFLIQDPNYLPTSWRWSSLSPPTKTSRRNATGLMKRSAPEKGSRFKRVSVWLYVVTSPSSTSCSSCHRIDRRLLPKRLITGFLYTVPWRPTRFTTTDSRTDTVIFTLWRCCEGSPRTPEVRSNSGSPLPPCADPWAIGNLERYGAISFNVRHTSFIQTSFLFLHPHLNPPKLYYRTVYPFYVLIFAALPLITLIRVAFWLDDSGHHLTHNESSNIDLLASFRTGLFKSSPASSTRSSWGRKRKSQQGSHNFFLSPSLLTLLDILIILPSDQYLLYFQSSSWHYIWFERAHW